MQDDMRNCGCDNNCGNGGFLNNLFGGCGCQDNSILFFILIFLLLFKDILYILNTIFFLIYKFSK